MEFIDWAPLPKSPVQARQCGEKRRWPSWRTARKAIRPSAAENHESHRLWDVYRCPWCGWLHIGHRPNQRNR